jgi:endonuclease YncB( thermonuclease family)
MYEYQAEVVRWVDGDTVRLAVDLGFGITRDDVFRLYGIDTPERGQPGHDAATAFCMGAAPVGSLVTIQSLKPLKRDKYGRWLAMLTPITTSTSVNDALVVAGLARPYFGATKGQA